MCFGPSGYLRMYGTKTKVQLNDMIFSFHIMIERTRSIWSVVMISVTYN